MNSSPVPTDSKLEQVQHATGPGAQVPIREAWQIAEDIVFHDADDNNSVARAARLIEDLVRRREASLAIQLEAWHRLFGTSQLSHAIAAKESLQQQLAAEKARADDLSKQVEELKSERTRMGESIINVCSGIDDGSSNFKSVPEMLVTLKHREQLAAESRLAALQAVADEATKKLERFLMHEPRASMQEREEMWFAASDALAKYRAFTAAQETK